MMKITKLYAIQYEVSDPFVPEDEEWLNPFNLKLALESYCPNTKFKVRDLITQVTTDE